MSFRNSSRGFVHEGLAERGDVNSDVAGKERERSDGSPWKIDQTA